MEQQPQKSTIQEVNVKEQGVYMSILHKFPKSFIRYIENHMKDGVVHIFYGYKMMARRKWNVVPYELELKNKYVLCNLNALSVFTFLSDVIFIIYNGTGKYFNFKKYNVIVINV